MQPYDPEKTLVGSDGSPQLGSYESDWQLNSMLLLANRILGQLNDQNETEQVLHTLIRRFIGAVNAYYRTGLNLIYSTTHDPFDPIKASGSLRVEAQPYSHRQMISRIGEEWSNLMNLVATARFLSLPLAVVNTRDLAQSDDQKISELLKQVLEQAQRDLNLADLQSALPQNKRVARFVALAQFGRNFELVSFSYAPEIAVVGIPFTSLYCPWDWTLIWHEVAGVYVEHSQSRQPDDESKWLSTSIIGRVREVLGHYLIERDAAPWIAAHATELPTVSHGRIEPFTLDNWAEELVEDAVGVLCLGPSMADNLEHTLRRYYAQSDDHINHPNHGIIFPIRGDDRHPPGMFRIAVARSLCAAMGLSEKVPDDAITAVANAVAAVIWEKHRMLVSRVFTSEDARLCDRLIRSMSSHVGGLNTIETGPAIALDKAIGELGKLDSEIKPYHLVAAITSAFRQHQADGSALRRAVAGQQAAPDLQRFTSELDLPGDLDEILEFSFSTTDHGYVTIDRNHKPHDTPSTATFTISDFKVRHQKHNFTIKLHHSHDSQHNMTPSSFED